MVVALTTLFPSLDLWRGGNNPAQQMTFAWPSATLLHGDYDAFEMLTRAVALLGDPHIPKPDPGYLLGGAIFRWVPFVANYFPDAGTGPAVARATGMGFTNVSMPLVGEGLVLGGPLMIVFFYVLLGVIFRWLGHGYSAGSWRFVGAVDAATASLLFLVLRGSLYGMLGYVMLTILCGRLLSRLPREQSPTKAAQTERRRIANGDRQGVIS